MLGLKLIHVSKRGPWWPMQLIYLYSSGLLHWYWDNRVIVPMEVEISWGIWVTWFDIWYDDVIKWKHFPRNWSFVREIHRSSVNFPHKGQWRGALMFSLICTWINGWINNGEAGDLTRHRAYYDVTVMITTKHNKYEPCAYVSVVYCISVSIAVWWNTTR